MRELSRFEEEFEDVYSIHSKIEKTLEVSKAIDELCIQKAEILKNEQEVCHYFSQQSEEVF